ncbi:hypothetical protein NECAME_19277, partial [Necator americanus]
VVVKWDKTEPVILEFATIICKLVAKQSWVVCDGISGQFRDEFFYVFRRLSDESPSKICGLLFNECADPDDITESGWTVELPPKPDFLYSVNYDDISSFPFKRSMEQKSTGAATIGFACGF